MEVFKINVVMFNNSSVFKGGVSLIVGLCLAFWPAFTSALIVKIIAGFLLCVGIFMIIGFLKAEKQGYMVSLNFVAMIASIVLGLLIFIFPGFFLNLLSFLFGIVLVIVGASQIFTLSGSRVSEWSYYITPTIVVLCGLIMFFLPSDAIKGITIFFGIVLVAYGISEIAANAKINRKLLS